MHDATFVRRFETVSDLRGHRDRLVERYRAAHQSSGKILPVHVLHDQRERARVAVTTIELDHAVDLRDAGVIAGGERLRLTFEPGEAFTIRGDPRQGAP